MSLVTDLVEHYQHLIERGELRPENVPTPTPMAAEWDVSVITAKRARSIIIHGVLDQKIKPLSEITDEDWERFLEKVLPPDDNGCTLWDASAPTGYGQFWFGGRMRPAHIVAYTYLVGAVPDGLHLDHVFARGCRSKLCVNVAHLEPVTIAENNKRMWSALRYMASIRVVTELDEG
ncbi:HNH endonuclease signature motif containing protein [Streptomyces sp. HNA39]|uniref:HNH endonuclease signature motif containing protein n=1 Tax=Streptomyces sp. HNA39 TaxID=2850561 RepID=UPI00200E6CD9|nr:HNH endonuclease signature motif containing protein [Streptomyces sp. HNA39]UQA37503.1 HNH endonuclease [Streptomyces sp. HNA39]